jgi:type III secretion system YscQ/HrcQ family protein
MIPTPKRPPTMHGIKGPFHPSNRPPGGGPGGGNAPPSEPPQPPQASGRHWKPFRWNSLEKVTRLQGALVKRLEWMLPGIAATGEVSNTVTSRLKELLEEDVSLTVDYVHVVATRNLRRYIGDPAFLAVLAPQPNKTRGFLEVELGLAHAGIDMLLGGGGEAISLRPLTDLEEGVMTYVIIETLKTLAPNLDPSLPRLRLEGVCRGFDDAVQLLGDESYLAVLQLKASFGTHAGYVRIMVPATVLAAANPPSEAAVRRARRAADAVAHIARLASVKAWLRAEIGHVEITGDELKQVRERDVVLIDGVTARTDRGEGGTCKLKIGAGLTGHFDAEVVVENGRYHAKLMGLVADEGDGVLPEEEFDLAALQEEAARGPDESTNPGTNPKLKDGKVDETIKGSEGAELLNDIPLQVAVELARVPITAEEIVALKVGQVIDLNRVAGEPIDLSVNGKIVARGELVEVDGNLGVRVLSLAG